MVVLSLLQDQCIFLREGTLGFDLLILWKDSPIGYFFTFYLLPRLVHLWLQSERVKFHRSPLF